MPQHAILSPSAAHMWLNCPPAAKLSEDKEDVGSFYSEQGTEAHSLCEFKLNTALGMECEDPRPDLIYLDEEMENCSDDYASFVMETLSKVKETCEDPIILIEQKLDLSKYVKEGFGYGDCLIVGNGQLHVIDFKYGLGVLVDSNENPQMMCYALGALELLDYLYDIESVSMTIFQPRRQNISTFEMSKKDLIAWANDVLKPTADLAYAGLGEFKAGSHCQFCKVKATCKKRAEYNLELAKYDFAEPMTLNDEEIAEILEKADEFISWAGDVKDFALSQALAGVKYPGFKVVAGRSVRKYTDADAVAEEVKIAGYEPFEQKLLGVTAMTSLLGRKKFDELLGGLIYKAPGKPTLVKESDKREALNTAKDDFKEE